MKRLSILFLLSSCAVAAADEDTSWHLLTQTQGGQMQLVKSLSKSECDFMMNRALGRPATQEEQDAEKKRREAETAAAKEREKISKAKEEAWRVARPECFPKDKDGNDKSPAYSSWPTDSTNICQKRYEVSGYATAVTGGGRYIQSGDIRSAECFQ